MKKKNWTKFFIDHSKPKLKCGSKKKRKKKAN